MDMFLLSDNFGEVDDARSPKNSSTVYPMFQKKSIAES